MSPSYRELLLNECTVKSSSTPSVVRTVWFEYNVPVPIDFFWGELPPLHFETQRFLENLVLYQAVRVCRLLVPSVITPLLGEEPTSRVTQRWLYEQHFNQL